MNKTGSATNPSASGPGTPSAAVTSQEPRWTEVLADGSHVLIRPIRKEDAELERQFIERLSPQSRRMRFLGQMSTPSEKLLRRLVDIDYVHDMAFVALVHRDNEVREVGVSRYSVGPDRSSCECAVTVDDQWHGLGLGTLLMRHLIDVARERGIQRMVSFDAADNLPMRDLARYLGFTRTVDPDDPRQVVHSLSL